ncbi:MAG: putative toxin-antitoxin system toxin component, PIN family [Candidatus Poribacteria bacterium]|nr:putative toxin-antitoxin system toxin component, PIN family [Candidatus Poribacteria bacterium]
MNVPEHRWRVYRITIDTNVLLRSLIRRKNDANQLLSLWRDLRFVLVLSHAILDEIREVLSRPELIQKYSYTVHSIAHLLNLLGQRAVIVEVPFSYELCRDVKDDPVADCAVWGRVQFLVSYDNDFLDDSALRRALFEFGVEIVHPRTFLETIQGT